MTDRVARPQRGQARLAHGIHLAVRAILVLYAVGGAVNLVAGLVTLNAQQLVGGALALLVGGLVLGTQFGASVAEAAEVEGPAGAFVVRTRTQPRWRRAHGFARLTSFLLGRRVWIVAVRRRADDPLGATVVAEDWPTARAASERAEKLARRIRDGADLSA